MTTTTTTNDREGLFRMTTTTSGDAVAAEARKRALVRDLRTAVRILDRDVKDLRAVPHGPAPAWTDFAAMYLNLSALPADVRSVRDVAVWAGAAYHELGHIVFSPRPGSPLADIVRRAEASVAPGLGGVWNLAEDQRQESAMVSRFSPVRGYFAAAVVGLILAGDAARAWPLVAGRHYLPREARDAVRAAWVAAEGEASAAEIARLIAAYSALADPGTVDATRAGDILLDLWRALVKSSPQTPTGCGAPQNRPGSPVPTSPPADPGEGEGEDGTEDGTGDASEDGTGEGTEAATDDGTEDGTEGGEGSGAGDASEDGTEDGTEAGTDPGTGAGGAGAGTDTSGGDPSADPGEAVREALSEALGDILASEDVAAELRDLAESALSGTGADRGDAKRGGTNYRRPSAEAETLREALGDTLRDLRAAADPEWIRGTDSGRVNVRRFADPAARVVDPATLFDRYSPDSLEDVSVSLAVLVDTSGSMGGAEADLSDALYAIHHAADAAEAELVAIGFNNDAALLIAPGEDPTHQARRVSASGGTDPVDALGMAWDTLRASEAGHRLVVILTDGYWSRAYRAEAIIAAMRSEGIDVTVAAFALPEAWATPEALESTFRHGADRIGTVPTLAAFARLVGEAVAARMSGALAH